MDADQAPANLEYPPPSTDLPFPPGDFTDTLLAYGGVLIEEFGQRLIPIVESKLSRVRGDSVNGNTSGLIECVQLLADLQRVVLLGRIFRRPLTIPPPVQRLIYSARHAIEGLAVTIGGDVAQDLRTLCYTLVSPDHIDRWTRETAGTVDNIEEYVDENLFRQQVRVHDLLNCFMRMGAVFDGGLGHRIGGVSVEQRTRELLNTVGRPVFTGPVIFRDRNARPLEQTAVRGRRKRRAGNGGRGGRRRGDEA
ncbi:hypothetical protein DFP72DRAFT_850660 [Ephemerocybe angulata]|uniref:Uncharacterized protein n=1 Tax=Ephemerocybe angulata TaxID=980116 RepID=A0A8H6M215_9AGAR|nr:hypothetical protein DFP72DRAFT_850660 [Tulosesus angulatus]